jgi:hypothetical protein
MAGRRSAGAEFATSVNGNTGKTAGVDALFSCAGSEKSDSSYV